MGLKKKDSIIEEIWDNLKRNDKINRLSKWKLFEPQIFFYIMLVVLKYIIDINILKYWNVSFNEFNGTLFDMIPTIILIFSCLICSFIYSFSLKKIKEYMEREEKRYGIMCALLILIIIPILIYFINKIFSSSLNTILYTFLAMIFLWVMFPLNITGEMLEFEENAKKYILNFLETFSIVYVCILIFVWIKMEEYFGMFLVIFLVSIILMAVGMHLYDCSKKITSFLDWISKHIKRENENYEKNKQRKKIWEFLLICIFAIMSIAVIRFFDTIIDATQKLKMEYHIVSYNPEDNNYMDIEYDDKVKYFYNKYFYVAVVYTTNDYFICKPLIQKNIEEIEIDRSSPAIRIPRSDAITYYTTSLNDLPREHIIIKVKREV